MTEDVLVSVPRSALADKDLDECRLMVQSDLGKGMHHRIKGERLLFAGVSCVDFTERSVTDGCPCKTLMSLSTIVHFVRQSHWNPSRCLLTLMRTNGKWTTLSFPSSIIDRQRGKRNIHRCSSGRCQFPLDTGALELANIVVSLVSLDLRMRSADRERKAVSNLSLAELCCTLTCERFLFT